MKLASRIDAVYGYEENGAAQDPTSRTAESDSGNTVFTYRVRVSCSHIACANPHICSMSWVV